MNNKEKYMEFVGYCFHCKGSLSVYKFNKPIDDKIIITWKYLDGDIMNAINYNDRRM